MTPIIIAIKESINGWTVYYSDGSMDYFNTRYEALLWNKMYKEEYGALYALKME